jgi:hypothetical protein
LHRKYFKMKNLKIIAFCLLGFSAMAQELNLTNCLIVGQLDKEGDRFSLEVSLTEFFAERGVKAVPSLNVLKQGSDIELLASDSLKQILAAKGVDTYMLVSVRGYDRRFKATDKREDLATALSYGTLFNLYRAEAVSVSFEFFIYRNGELVKSEIIKCGNVSSRETVLKRLSKKLDRKVKKW